MPRGGTWTSGIVDSTEYGTLEFNTNGNFTYTPDPGFIGLDEFTYSTCSDRTCACDTGTAYIVVVENKKNKEMVFANPDLYISGANTKINKNVQSNDYDPDDEVWESKVFFVSVGKMGKKHLESPPETKSILKYHTRYFRTAQIMVYYFLDRVVVIIGFFFVFMAVPFYWTFGTISWIFSFMCRLVSIVGNDVAVFDEHEYLASGILTLIIATFLYLIRWRLRKAGYLLDLYEFKKILDANKKQVEKDLGI